MNLLERFAATLKRDDTHIIVDMQDYVEWQVGRHNAEFVIGEDDVEVRNYLLHLRIARATRKQLRQKVNSLQCFYDWAKREGLIEYNPFAEFDFTRPFLPREAIRRRQEILPDDPHEREMTRLRALNELAQHLNRAADMQSALDITLNTLVTMMELQTAWVFLLPELHTHIAAVPARPPHDFALTAACNLPPGLEQEDRRFLCQPGDCHCQGLLRQGRLTRAVNIVECTRMQDSARANGDNRGLFFHASVPIIIAGVPLGIINVATEEWQFFTAADLQLLSTVGSQVAIALERARLYDVARAQQQRLQRELEMAREVQASLLPDRMPSIRGFTLTAHWQSAREVAGDFYDVFQLPDNRLGLIIADVSDKGAPAALYMAMARSLIRTNAAQFSSAADVLKAVNYNLIEHAGSDMFVTVFYAILDTATGKLTYASAGHDPPLLRRASGDIEHLMPTGALLGILDELPMSDETVEMASGDLLLMYTDGVTDAMNVAEQHYGRDRLAQVLRQTPVAADEGLQYILADLATFTQSASQPDDITFMVLVNDED